MAKMLPLLKLDVLESMSGPIVLGKAEEDLKYLKIEKRVKIFTLYLNNILVFVLDTLSKKRPIHPVCLDYT